jgi:hypothetical protein
MKTFEEIKKEATENSKNRYYRGFTFMRSRALTAFIEELSKKETFSFICGNFVKSFNRDGMTENSTLTLTTYAGFNFNGKEYYFQYDENVFFDAYFTITDKDTHTYPIVVNDIIYNGVEWDNSEENYNLFLSNLKLAFDGLNYYRAEKYRKTTPSYMAGQRIYYN